MGEKIAGRWELREPIASGASSTVWEAFDHQLGKPCAAKLLRQRDAGQLLRFAREQTRRLTGRRVVAPYAWVADDGTALIAFELVRGGSLRTLIGDYGALSDGTIVVILDQLLDALQIVHRAQIVHRDLTPANVLLRATGEGPLDIALADFGIAIAASEARLTRTGMVTGTPGYVAPEVLLGATVPEPSHDLFALGMVAVALVLGREGGSVDQAMDQIGDPQLAEAVAAMTQFDPAERPGDVEEVRLLLEQAGRDELPHDREGEPIVVLEQIAADHGGEQTKAMSPADLDDIELDHRTEPQLDVQNPQFEVEQPQLETSKPQPEVSKPQSEVGEPQLEVSKSQPEVKNQQLDRRKTRRPVVIAGAVAVLLGGTIWMALNLGQQPGPILPTTESPSTQTTVPAPPTTAPVPPTSAPTTAPAPSGPTEAREIGDACSWQVEGDFATASDGSTLSCQLIDGGYSWQPAR